MMPVLVQIPENPNCDAVDGLVFECRTARRTVTHVLSDDEWCPITGIAEGGEPVPATACLIDDSGDGMAYLVVGGDWGLRLRRPDDDAPWSLDRATQWGETHLLLSADARDLRFAALTGRA